MTSTQQKLQTVFLESYQIKRVSKEIQNLKTLKQKSAIELRMFIIHSNSLKFSIQLNPSYFKKSSNQNLIDAYVDICITIDKDFPSSPPKLHFTSSNLQYYHFLPFRDYFPLMVPQWSAKYTIVDIIKMFPDFLFNQERIAKSTQAQFSSMQYFELDKIFSWNFCQSFPVRYIRNNQNIQGFILFLYSEIVTIQQTQLQSFYFAVDLIPLKQVVSVLKSKTHPNKILIEISRKSKTYGIQIISQQYDMLVICIMDRVRAIISSSKQIQSESSQAEQEYLQEEKKEEINIEEIKQNSQMTSDNVSTLVLLLKKAIQYYSAISDPNFKIYLKKMQELMSNQMAQGLIASQSEIKQQKKSDYPSIIDYI